MVGVPLVLGSTAFCWYRVWSCSKEWALGVRSSIVCGVVVEEERCASHWLVSEETCARSIHAKVSIKVIIASRVEERRRSGGGGTAVQWRRRCMGCGHGMLWWKGAGRLGI
jgi:hypothetical protein